MWWEKWQGKEGRSGGSSFLGREARSEAVADDRNVKA